MNELKYALIEFIKNPVIYWVILLAIILNYKRRKRERQQFGKQVHYFLPSWTNTCIISLLCSIFISFIAIYFGLYITYEIILILSIVIICFSLIYQHTFLSVSYTLGFTYFLLVLSIQHLFDHSNAILISVVCLIGLFLIIEAVFVRSIKNNHVYPERWKSRRGRKFGLYRLQKMTIIPLFIFVPDGVLTPFLPIFPFGNGQYNVAIVPVVLGFSYLARNRLPQLVVKTISRQTFLLGIIVIIGAIIGLYEPIILSYVVLIAIIGRLAISFMSINKEYQSSPTFFEMENKPTIFWVEKNSVAEKIGLQIGDTITKINGETVQTREDVDELLYQHKNEHLIFCIEDSQHEQRTINKAVFAKNREELGIHFIH